MFTITPSQQQYLTYILADTDTPSCLEVVPAQGGIIKGIYPFSGSFDFQSPEIDVAFTALKSNVTSLRDNQRGLEVVRKSNSSLFSTLVFWTVKGKDYVCLEPLSAPRNALNSDEQLTPLAAQNLIGDLDRANGKLFWIFWAFFLDKGENQC